MIVYLKSTNNMLLKILVIIFLATLSKYLLKYITIISFNYVKKLGRKSQGKIIMCEKNKHVKSILLVVSFCT